jgi:hypothetical protein
MNTSTQHKTPFSLLTSRSLNTGWTRLALLTLLLWGAVGCGLRTVVPIKYIPLLGKEKEIATTSVLARALRDKDLSVRAQSVKVLGILSQSSDKKVKKSVSRVLGMALKDRDPGIRLQAVEMLGKMEEKFSNKYLLSALKDPNPFVREKVLQTLMSREGLPSAAGLATGTPTP